MRKNFAYYIGRVNFPAVIFVGIVLLMLLAFVWAFH